MPIKPKLMQWPFVLLLSGLAVIGFLYSLAWSGSLLYDDPPNLDGLYGVSGWISGLNFILTGAAGPTGRPLSLLTFALQHASWPDPEPFLVVNTVLHGLNAVLVFLLARLVFRLTGPGAERTADWAAVFVALLWAASPFLASAPLMVVQRMTLLSAAFVLLTLLVYMRARLIWSGHAFRGASGLVAIAGGGTLLAGLAKENGFLLPVFLLLVELLLVPAAGGRIKALARPALSVLLILPMGLIGGYLAYRGIIAAGYETRSFDLLERLLTQARVLFSYLRHLLLPAAEGVSPFHDGYPASSGLLTPWTTLPAVIGVTMLAAFGWLSRKVMPVLAFGILFFLSGHLLESTVLPLEMYYPHRNYVPAVGLYLALAAGIGRVAGQSAGHRRLLVAFSVLYTCAFIAVLAYGTSLWGRPWLSAEIWYQQNPDSIRAKQYLARELNRIGNPTAADRILQKIAAENAGQPEYSLEPLKICDREPSLFRDKLERAIFDLENAKFISTKAASLIREYAATASNNDCESFGLPEAHNLVEAAWQKSESAIGKSARQHLLFAHAQLAEQTGNYEEAIERLRQALQIRPNLDAVLIVAYLYRESGNLEKGIEFVKEMSSDPPVGLLNALIWRYRLENLLTAMKEEAAERS